MALTDEGNGMVMPVAPFYGGGGNGMGGFGNGDSWAWLILILLLAGVGGWGNNGNGGGFGGGNGIYPWMNQANLTSEGFQNQLMNDNITSIRDGVHNLSTQLCNCCGDMQMALANGFAGVEQGANARQIANMQQGFATQTAITGGLTNLSSQLANCCCENRLGIANLSADIARENCADRENANYNTRDIINAITTGVQSIKDDIYADRLEDERRENQNLRTQLNMATLNASQIAQTAQLQRGQTEEVDALYNRLRNCPVPSMPVYGMTPIFTCPQNQTPSCGCGCGCGGNAF